MNPRLPSLTFPEYGLLLLDAVVRLKEAVRGFFYQVMLSQFCCPKCKGELEMVGSSLSRCTECGNTIDPTVEFQRCMECGGNLVKKTFHYYCETCKKVVQSRFLFDERVFDATYFREMMRESRERKRQKRAEIEAMLKESRSEPLIYEDFPNLRDIEGLTEALDSMVGSPLPRELLLSFARRTDFDLQRYREHIQKYLQEACEILFDDIGPLIDDGRRDRVFRFIALIFMCHWGEIALIQYGDKLVVEKIEAHCEG